MLEVWQAEQVHRCPDCGTFEWEWEEQPEAWHADVHWCLGCRDKELRSAEILREHPDGGIEGWKLRLYRGAEEEG